MIKFGVAGNSASFYAEGCKHTVEAADWCRNRGLDCFEYSFGKGVKMSSETAETIGRAFATAGLEISVHAPYFINFANPDPEKIENSISYVTSSLLKTREMGGRRVVFHPASQGKVERSVAHKTALDNFLRLADRITEEGYDDMKICVETMGKLNQLGTVDEVIDYVSTAPFFYPCIDFGHVNAREQGILKTTANYNTLIEKMLDNLPKNKVFDMHVHFSKIAYGPKGELYHLTFADDQYGPEFPPLAESLHRYGLEPYVICESDGTQAEDALTMKKIYWGN